MGIHLHEGVYIGRFTLIIINCFNGVDQLLLINPNLLILNLQILVERTESLSETEPRTSIPELKMIDQLLGPKLRILLRVGVSTPIDDFVSFDSLNARIVSYNRGRWSLAGLIVTLSIGTVVVVPRVCEGLVLYGCNATSEVNITFEVDSVLHDD
jgi:hypothetical protein